MHAVVMIVCLSQHDIQSNGVNFLNVNLASHVDRNLPADQ